MSELFPPAAGGPWTQTEAPGPEADADPNVRAVVMTGRGAALNVGVLLASRLVIAALGLVVVIVLSRYLGPAGYGRLTLGFAFSGIVTAVADAGLGAIGARELARATTPVERARLASALLGLSGVVTAVSVAGGWCVLLLAFSGAAQSGVREAVEILLLTVLATPVSLMGTAASAAAGRAYLAGVAQATAAVVVAALVVLGARWGWSFGPIVLAVGAGNLVPALVFLVLERGVRTLPSAVPSTWRRLGGEALSLTVVNAINVIYVKADVLLLAALASETAVGVYGVAYNVVSLLIAVPALVLSAVQPVLVRSSGDSARFGEIIRYVTLVLTLIAGGLVVPLVRFAPTLATVLTGPHYRDGGGVLRVLVVGVALTFPSGILGAGLTALGRQREILKPILLALVLNLVANVALIPRFGAHGAAWAFTGTEGVVLAVTAYRYRDAVPLRLERPWALLGVLGCTVLPCVLGPVIVSLPPVPSAAIWSAIGICGSALGVRLTGLSETLTRFPGTV